MNTWLSVALIAILIHISAPYALAEKEMLVDTTMLFNCISTCKGNIVTNDHEVTNRLSQCINQCLTEQEDKKEASLDIVRRYRGCLYSYRPSYIGVTTHTNDEGDEGQLKFQLSFKYPLVQEGWLKNLYFGYTQKSIWSIHKLSAPFKENNFAPEIFYIYDQTASDSFFKAIIVGIARHESTGESGTGSRGWNISYIEPFIQLTDSIMLTLKLWAPMLFLPKDKMFETDNGDIFKYYGYGELGLKWNGYENKIQWRNMFRHGTDERRYGFESQVDFRIPWLQNRYFNPTLFIQLWNGYGETLKTYNRSSTDVVIGISAIR